MDIEEITADLAARGIRSPASATLAKYGWSLREWYQMLKRQSFKCPICDQTPLTGQFVTDHEHTLRWARMPAARRKLYVRGLLCWFDNRHIVVRGASPQKLRNAARYLARYERRSRTGVRRRPK